MPVWIRWVGLAVLAAALGWGGYSLFASGEPEPTPLPTVRATPTPEPERDFVIDLVDVDTTAGEATVKTTGVLRLRGDGSGEPEITNVALAIGALETANGPTGPIHVAPSDEARTTEPEPSPAAEATATPAGTPGVAGPAVPEGTPEATASPGAGPTAGAASVRLLYPLLLDVAGEARDGHILLPERMHTAGISFDGEIDGRRWRGTLTISPDALEGLDEPLPTIRIPIDAPAVSEPQGGTEGARVACITTEGDPPGDGNLGEALAELRRIWWDAGVAVLTPEEIQSLNEQLAALQLGGDQIRFPDSMAAAGCVQVTFTTGSAGEGGIAVDLAARSVTIGGNALDVCPGASAGRLMAHGIGHLLLRTASEGEGETLMAPCAPAPSIPLPDAEGWGAILAEVPRTLAFPDENPQENAAYGELSALMDLLMLSPSPTPTPEATPRPTRRPTPPPTATPAPTPTPTPAPTPTPSPTPTPMPSPTPTPTPTPTP